MTRKKSGFFARSQSSKCCESPVLLSSSGRHTMGIQHNKEKSLEKSLEKSRVVVQSVYNELTTPNTKLIRLLKRIFIWPTSLKKYLKNVFFHHNVTASIGRVRI